jgi:small subunit ribosomal protein S15|tara:strand:+ start:145 stop:405 length:261 start_codon:yes stop_codon:yes gene_type:complete
MQENKNNIAKEFKISENDNGSTPVQIALISSRIDKLTEHSKIHKHDYSSKKGLVMLVDKRRKLLSYLSKNDNKKYQDVLKSLGLRR